MSGAGHHATGPIDQSSFLFPETGKKSRATEQGRKGGQRGANLIFLSPKGGVRRKTSRRTTSFGPADVFVGIICGRTRK
jgi:hypothetical protein